MDIEFKYFEDSKISIEQYSDFLVKCYGEQAKHKLDDRLPWLKKRNNYRILLAIENRKIIGQACCYDVIAVVEGKEIQLTWGIDNFVLPEARGKGVGKILQKILHESMPNFSSAWYSPTNGHIKKSCGAKSFISTKFPYYAISKFLGIYLEILLRLVLKRTIQIKPLKPNLYYRLLYNGKLNHYTLTEINGFTKEHIDFINDSLANKFDFYIKRDEKYLKWKYDENPSIKGFHIIEVKKENRIVAVISFTKPRIRSFLLATYWGVTILDLFVKDEKMFKNKDALKIVVEFYKNRGIMLDGISTFFDVPYSVKICYPSKGIPFLSTYEGNIKKAYISFLDQDIEQI